jgi:hypothetical protein
MFASGNKKVRSCFTQHADFPCLKSPDLLFTFSQSPESFVLFWIKAGLLTCESSSRRLPGQYSQWFLPFVVAYSGGSVEDSHLTSLSSPDGHR